MRTLFNLFLSAGFLLLFQCASGQGKSLTSVSVPFILDHNRMLVDAEIQRKDGTWREVRLWIDSGNPTFFMSEPLARDLGIDLSVQKNSTAGIPNLDVDPPTGIRIGGKNLSFENVKSKVIFQPFWLFSTMHNDANLPSTLLKKYHIVFDYPARQLTIADPGSLKPRGIPFPAIVHPETGIVQLNATIDEDSLSFALDNGASYSFISEERLTKLLTRHSDWPHMTGTLGFANMWGWWPPNEQMFPVVRIPEMLWGQEKLKCLGIVGVPRFSPSGPSLGEWYSQKTARPVDGFLGANAFKAFRVEIDYGKSLVYFEKGNGSDTHEMEMVGLSVRQLPDSSYQIVGLAGTEENSSVKGVEPGDILFSIGDFQTKGSTMGKVVDALRGRPGDLIVLTIERNGKRFKIESKVEHFL